MYFATAAKRIRAEVAVVIPGLSAAFPGLSAEFSVVVVVTGALQLSVVHRHWAFETSGFGHQVRDFRTMVAALS